MRTCGRWSGEEDALRHRLVKHLGARELGLQDGEVVAIAGGAVAGRKRMPQALEPFAQQASILPAESSSHTRLGVGTGLDAVVQRLERWQAAA
jgi:hypothetical protein